MEYSKIVSSELKFWGAVKQIRLGPRRHNEDRQPAHGVLVEEARPALKKPPMYKVVMFNDDYTPMEFVVGILETFFGMDRELAVRVMLKVHTEGKAVCGIFTRDVAETKVVQVNRYSRDNEHPLICEIEPADTGDDQEE